MGPIPKKIKGKLKETWPQHEQQNRLVLSFRENTTVIVVLFQSEGGKNPERFNIRKQTK